MTSSIALSRIHFPVTTLGPGRRIGIWFQGCSIRCPGCISMDTWAPGRGVTTVDDVVNAVTQWLPAADGITISGGEPFDQPIALIDLLGRLRSLTEADVLVFTGHPWTRVRETLDASPGVDRRSRYGPVRCQPKPNTRSSRQRQPGTPLPDRIGPNPLCILPTADHRGGKNPGRHVR